MIDVCFLSLRCVKLSNQKNCWLKTDNMTALIDNAIATSSLHVTLCEMGLIKSHSQSVSNCTMTFYHLYIKLDHPKLSCSVTIYPGSSRLKGSSRNWNSVKVPCCFEELGYWQISLSLDVPVRFYWNKNSCFWRIQEFKQSTSWRQVVASLVMMHKKHKLSPTLNWWKLQGTFGADAFLQAWLWIQ